MDCVFDQMSSQTKTWYKGIYCFSAIAWSSKMTLVGSEAESEQQTHPLVSRTHVIPLGVCTSLLYFITVDH